MRTLLIRSWIFLFPAFFSSVLVPLKGQQALDRYIEAGLKNNLVLQQKGLSLEKAMFALKESNRLFFPSVTLLGDYLSGSGGRSIDIPVGDLMNPVYSTLNQLTSSQSFPQIENSSTNFLPENYYDVKLRTSMPLFNNDLIRNKKIQNERVLLQEEELEVYKKELTKNIEVAYYRYLAALNAVTIYESAGKLAEEGKRVNESLLKNGKSVMAYVIRSESEILTLEAKRNDALRQSENARLYFNFLINTDAASQVDTATTGIADLASIESLIVNPADISRRGELMMLQNAASIQEQLLKKDKGYWYPRLNGFLDLGSQAADFKYNDQSRFYLVGVQLEIPIFTFGKNSYNAKQSEIDYRHRLLENDLTKKQIQLSADAARNDLAAALENYKAALKQLEAASIYQRLIERGYREGVNSFIETLDARNQVTTANMQLVIDRYTLLGKLAIYKREQSL